MNPDQNYLSIRELNGYIRMMMERDELLSAVSLRCEISNMKRHSSGHLYFSLKDEEATVSAVMFRAAASTLNFVPRDGMKVLVFGRVSLYEKSGQYQVYVQAMMADGVGDLYRAYEELRRRLEAEGLFDPARKKPLPKLPRRIGVITSPTGAAVRDILQVTGRRCPLTDILLFPALVQGSEAPASLCAGLAYFHAEQNVDVIIIGRGGGSIEDLWAFNDEAVVRAVAASKIPVISAVGHETDTTLCDFAADRRAPTPSAAAELAVPDMAEARAYLLRTEARLGQGIGRTLSCKREELMRSDKALRFASPQGRLERSRAGLLYLTDKIERTVEHRLALSAETLRALAGRLATLSPLAVLGRGYSLVENGEGKVVSSVARLTEGDALTLRMQDGRVRAEVREILPHSTRKGDQRDER